MQEMLLRRRRFAGGVEEVLGVLKGACRVEEAGMRGKWFLSVRQFVSFVRKRKRNFSFLLSRKCKRNGKEFKSFPSVGRKWEGNIEKFWNGREMGRKNKLFLRGKEKRKEKIGKSVRNLSKMGQKM